MATTMSYHVNGPVVPQCNVGTANAYVPIGVCREGADISIRPLVHPIKSDGGGGQDGGAVEYIQLNAIATIRFQLVPYAGDYVNALRKASMAIAAAGSEGVLPVPGTLFGANNFFPALYLPYGSAAEVDGPWWFPKCRVVNPGSNRVSTKESMPDWEFEALIYFNPATHTSIAQPTSPQNLYARSAPV